MHTKQTTINKFLCSLLIVLCSLFLFVACPDLEVTDSPYDNPNDGVSRDFKFSHDSGLYTAQFSLSITAAPKSTIYYTTDGSIPSPGKAGTVEYTAPITIKDRNNPMQPNVLATPAARFYGVPGDRGNNMPSVYNPTNAQVPKATVIRAIAVDASGKQSGVATKTYFIGDNLSGYGNTRIVSLVSDPEGLVSEETGIMVRGASGNRWDGTPYISNYNFQRKGDDWERAAHLEIFDGDTSSRSVFSVGGVGIRVRGGWSRATGQKSFTVYFKEKWGIKNLSRSTYDLIPGAVKADGSRVDTFKGFMLRNGANDAEYTKFWDVFLQELLNDRSFATQASEPCIVYLNGEYWGPYNLQERYSDNHTGFKYGVENENVISYDNGEIDDGAELGGEALYQSMIGMRNLDMSNQKNYDDFCKVFDIDNFIDYWAAEIYIHNQDWPQNNYRVWRTHTKVNDTYGDTRWRYQMFDVEFAMGIYDEGACLDAFERILTGENSNDNNNSKLFKALLANEGFCRQFVNTMMDLYNVNFHPDKFEPLLTSYANTYGPLMGDTDTPGTYFSRWGRPWDTVFENNVGKARNYLTNIRNIMVYTFLPRYFGGSYSGINSSIGNAYDVTFSTTGYSAPIKVNTITVQPGWTGKYFSGNLITVTAPDVSGYTFGGWTVTSGTATTPSASTTTVNITGNAQIIANYLVGSAAKPVTDITLNHSTYTLNTGGNFTLTATVTPSDATYKTVYWISSDPTVASVNNNTGVVTAVSSGTATITANTSENTHTATCTVTVNPVVTGVSLDVSTFNIFVDDTRKLIATVLPSNAPNKLTTWSSSNSSVARVTDDGTVTAIGSGTATITVTTIDGSRTATCTVNVKAEVDALVLLDLAAHLQTKSAQAINDQQTFDDVFQGLMIGQTNDIGTEVTYAIIDEGGTKKLQVNELINYGCGLQFVPVTDWDSWHSSGEYNENGDEIWAPLFIQLEAGDRIEVKGRRISGPSGGVYVTKNAWGYDTLQGWDQSLTDGQTFERIFTLTEDDAVSINHYADIRYGVSLTLKRGGVSPWSGAIGNYGSFVIEQFKVISPRP